MFSLLLSKDGVIHFSQSLLLFDFFWLEDSFMLKSWGLGGVVAHEILVTAQRPNTPFPFLELTLGDFVLGL